MTETLRCAVCGVALAAGAHYVVRIELFADPAMGEMDGDAEGGANKLAELLRQMEKMTESDLMDDVHRRFEYTVCRACQRMVLGNPLGLPRRETPARN